MDLIFGHFGKYASFEKENRCFSLNGKRKVFSRHFPRGFILSNIDISRDEVTLGIEDSQFQKIKICDDGLTIKNDVYGLRPLFIYDKEGEFIFSTEVEPILEALGQKAKLDERIINEYLDRGIINGPETFIRDVRNLLPREKISYTNDRVKKTVENEYKDISSSLNSSDTYEEIKEILFSSVQKWIKKYSIRGANLTGGADTRLLLALLTKEQREEFIFFTERSPHLKEEEDKDVLAAKALAERFGLKHEVRVHIPCEIDDDQAFMRAGPATILKLSGNHGGEILGGDVFSAMDFLKSTSWKSEFNDNYPHLVSLLFRPFFSDIYGGGVFNQWTMPFRFSARKCAPFWDQRLIGLLSQMNEEKVIHYHCYAEVFRRFFPSFMKVPFVSPIAQYHHDFKFMEEGRDQKRVGKKKTPVELLYGEKELIERVHYFSFEQLQGLCEKTILRSLKVNRWINFFIKERKFS